MVGPAEKFKYIKIKESDVELLQILLTTANIKGSTDLNESFQRIALITRTQDALARSITEEDLKELILGNKKKEEDPKEGDKKPKKPVSKGKK